MHDANIRIKDLTEMERLVIGSSLNFVYNLFNNQINNIERHDSGLTELLLTNENLQEDYILLQNFREVTEKLTNLVGETFSKLSDEEAESLSIPGIRLNNFLKEIFEILCCDNNN